MTVIYVLDDGRRLKARRVRELIEMLRAESWIGRGDNKTEWMRDAAGRALKTTGHRVRFDTEANFVHDLLKVGLLKKETT
jgi:hypothetical protein